MAVLIASLAMWGVAGVIVGASFARRDWRMFDKPGFFTRLRRWETRRFYERWLQVRSWKDRLPEAGTWFGGLSKRRLPTSAQGGRIRFAAESLRAERVHHTLLLVIPVAMVWSRDWWMIFNIVVGLVVNMPCIVVARYNRVRVALLA